MKIKEYNIKVHSISRFLIGLGIFMNLNLILCFDYLYNIDNKIILFIQSLILFIFSCYLSHYLTFGKIRLKITNKGIEHIWVKRFLFNKEPNFIIPWNRIVDFETTSHQLFDQTFINLTNQIRYKINRCNAILIKDDFKAFVKEFPELLKTHKQGGQKNI